MDDREVRRFIRLIRDTFTRIEQMPQPVIAAINGFAFGGGTELALACDIRIAEQHAVMGLTETSLGIIPGAGGHSAFHGWSEKQRQRNGYSRHKKSPHPKRKNGVSSMK